ncbi:MAG: hypothetical protein QM809_17200 [Gordonia sp. (in: high G+C Gram-positive bacteria)]|uniref:hypothetical protein n=1 Tax=Gordonia sp. (in: high G+C Gram-positive bacteria) TaxID=84139 RepID=UPI0039E34930
MHALGAEGVSEDLAAELEKVRQRGIERIYGPGDPISIPVLESLAELWNPELWGTEGKQIACISTLLGEAIDSLDGGSTAIPGSNPPLSYSRAARIMFDMDDEAKSNLALNGYANQRHAQLSRHILIKTGNSTPDWFKNSVNGVVRKSLANSLLAATEEKENAVTREKVNVASESVNFSESSGPKNQYIFHGDVAQSSFGDNVVMNFGEANGSK